MRRLSEATAVVGCLVALTACGSSSHHSGGGASASSGNGVASKPPATIVADAAAALKRAHGYVMEGQIVQSGQVQTIRAIANRGSLDVVMSNVPGHLEARILPRGTFVNVDQAFLKAHGQSGPVARALAGRWLEMPAATAQTLTSQLGPFAPRTMARCLAENHGTLTLGGRTTIAGRPAILVKDAGNVPGDAPSILAVATTGPPYPLLVKGTGRARPGGRIDACNDGKGSNTRGQITLSQFNQPPPIAAPPNPLKVGGGSGTI